jgi:hypothetical protein
MRRPGLDRDPAPLGKFGDGGLAAKAALAGGLGSIDCDESVAVA